MQISNMFKELGYRIAQLVRQDGQYLSPLLAAFTARVITLERSGDFPVENLGTNLQGVSAYSLPPKKEAELIDLTYNLALSQDDPLYETIKMQVTFEGYYAMELQRLRNKHIAHEEKNQQLINQIVQVGTNLVSSAQVAALYRLIFKLLLANGGIDRGTKDRNVEREVAVALESVFPQAGLNAFNMMSAAGKRTQIENLVGIVMGIRLFNKEIRHGGAGIADVPTLVTAELNRFYDRLEVESQQMSDVCFTLTDLINLEYQRPGTIFANMQRLQQELTNRRQYVLFLHQLQHEVVEAQDIVSQNKQILQSHLAQLKGIVGLRTQVPKDQVYPAFQVISRIWKTLVTEREKAALRASLLTQIQQFRDSFHAVSIEEDLPSLKHLQAEVAGPGTDFDSFVQTTALDATSAEEEGSSGGGDSEDDRPKRLVKETVYNFLSLPLEYQGYCPGAIVDRGGLLLPGDPNLGIIRFGGRHYSFASVNAMRNFCRDPHRYVDGVVLAGRHTPCLIHLLGLQPYVPNSDISEFFTLADFADHRVSVTAQTVDAQTQIGVGEYINTDIPDPNYEWNEWTMRKQALQMADLMNKRTVSTQTDLSHFRRDNATQTSVKAANKEGVMPGVGTQTLIEKGTNVARTKRHHFGLRGARNAQYQCVETVTPPVVHEGTNSDLRELASKILTRPILREYEPLVVATASGTGTATAATNTATPGTSTSTTSS